MRTRSITRRTFTRSLALGAAAAALPAGALLAVAGKRLKVGHTGITWGFKPTDAEQAIADVGSLGFAGYESFGNVLEFWDKQGGLKRRSAILQRSKLVRFVNATPQIIGDRSDQQSKYKRNAPTP